MLACQPPLDNVCGSAVTSVSSYLVLPLPSSRGTTCGHQTRSSLPNNPSPPLLDASSVFVEPRVHEKWSSSPSLLSSFAGAVAGALAGSAGDVAGDVAPDTSGDNNGGGGGGGDDVLACALMLPLVERMHTFHPKVYSSPATVTANVCREPHATAVIPTCTQQSTYTHARTHTRTHARTHTPRATVICGIGNLDG